MNFSKVMAAFDFSKFDQSILAYLKYITHPFGITEAHFVHVIRIMALPNIKRINPGLKFKQDYQLDQLLENRLQKEVDAYNLPMDEDNIYCKVHEGRPVEQLVCWSEHQNIDLVILGNKQTHEGSGITARRMAHRLKSNLLFIPEKSITPIQDIVVPIDFSENSAQALQAANHIYDSIDGVKIRAVHIQETTPASLYPESVISQKNSELSTERNMAVFEKMLEENDIDKSGIELVMLDQSRGSIAQTLKEYLSINPSDLVIMGSVGHSLGHNILYGSTTESFVDIHLDSPILIIRQ